MTLRSFEGQSLCAMAVSEEPEPGELSDDESENTEPFKNGSYRSDSQEELAVARQQRKRPSQGYNKYAELGWAELLPIKKPRNSSTYPHFDGNAYSESYETHHAKTSPRNRRLRKSISNMTPAEILSECQSLLTVTDTTVNFLCDEKLCDLVVSASELEHSQNTLFKSRQSLLGQLVEIREREMEHSTELISNLSSCHPLPPEVRLALHHLATFVNERKSLANCQRREFPSQWDKLFLAAHPSHPYATPVAAFNPSLPPPPPLPILSLPPLMPKTESSPVIPRPSIYGPPPSTFTSVHRNSSNGPSRNAAGIASISAVPFDPTRPPPAINETAQQRFDRLPPRMNIFQPAVRLLKIVPMDRRN